MVIFLEIVCKTIVVTITIFGQNLSVRLRISTHFTHFSLNINLFKFLRQVEIFNHFVLYLTPRMACCTSTAEGMVARSRAAGIF